MSETLRVVCDTNTLISYLLWPNSAVALAATPKTISFWSLLVPSLC